MVLANPTGTWTAADGAALYGLERWWAPSIWWSWCRISRGAIYRCPC